MLKIIHWRLATVPFFQRSQASQVRHFYYARGAPPHSISTLHPDRLTGEDFLDLTGRLNPTLLFSGDQQLMIDYQIYIGRRTPFPPATHGFLYYYNPYPLPEFMGHLRFRVTPNGDPSTFKQGHDLLLPSRVPWKFASLLGRRPSNITQIITEQLSLDGLIDDKVIGQMQQIRRHWEHVRLSLPSMDDVITGLGQEFIFNFTPNQYFWVMNFSEQGELQVGRTQIHIFSRQMHQGKPLPYDECYPYPGKAFTRFELAHPENPYLFVLRVTKILEPIVEIKRQPPGPREGELIKRISQKGKREDKAFVLDSRHATYSALGLLLHGTQQS